MIYLKSDENGILTESPLSAVTMFCKCPECGAEVRTTGGDLLELAKTFGDSFDFDECALYCDTCTQKHSRIREQLHAAIDRMPLHEAEQLAELIHERT